MEEEILNINLNVNGVKIECLATRQAIIDSMKQYAALALSEARDENIEMIKDYKYNSILEYIEPYLSFSEKSIDFVHGATWMRDEILNKL